MKKTFLLVIALFFGLAVSAQALTLWSGEPGWNTGEGWDNTPVYNMSGSGDIYDPNYFGYSGDDYTGYYLGTFSGNTDQYFVDAIKYYADKIGLDFDFGQIVDYTANTDGSGGTQVTGNSMTIGPLTVTYDPSKASGTWTFENYDVHFYALKGGNEFALYYVPGGGASGEWTNQHLKENPRGQSPAISHITVAAQVPEPATMLLMGTGLLFLAGFLRRRIYNRK
jgi:hypothetical protein